MPHVSQVALALRDVGHAYAGRPPVLRHATLVVPRGRVTVVLGANGSGKTTMLRLAAGLARPQSGSVQLGDGTPAHAAIRAGRVGYIPQQLGLVRSASVLDNVLMGGLRETGALRSLLGLHGRDVRDRALAALDLVGLRAKEEEPAKRLSGGERQRVAIARTLVQRPEAIVADELIASLDAVQAHAVMQVLAALKRQGVGILTSLHQIDVALANADQVAFLVHGGLSNPRAPGGMSPEEARCALAA